jgi:hypothetical protein
MTGCDTGRGAEPGSLTLVGTPFGPPTFDDRTGYGFWADAADVGATQIPVTAGAGNS